MASLTCPPRNRSQMALPTTIPGPLPIIQYSKTPHTSNNINNTHLQTHTEDWATTNNNITLHWPTNPNSEARSRPMDRHSGITTAEGNKRPSRLRISSLTLPALQITNRPMLWRHTRLRNTTISTATSRYLISLCRRPIMMVTPRRRVCQLTVV